MAEVVAVGLSVSIVEVSAKVLARLYEYHSVFRGMPGAFQDLKTRLPVIRDTMEQIKKECEGGLLTAIAQLHTVESCLEQITRLEELIGKIVPVLTDSLRQRLWKTITYIRKRKDVAEIEESLRKYEGTLSLRFSVRLGTSVAISSEETTYYEVPSLRVSQFVGRVELLKEIEANFTNTTGNTFRPKIVVLLGMGGQGKTQLALEFCRVARASRRFQAIFWIDASSLNTVSRGFETIAAKISTGQVFNGVESKIAFVKETLGKWRIPWLIVFDNYDRPSRFRTITTYFPQGETGAMLFTSRHTDSERLGVAIRVGGMTEDEGLELLCRQSKVNDNNVAEGRKIIQKLGYLPLAIDQAGAYISARNLQLRLFMEHYDERKEFVLKYTPSFWEYRRQLGEGEDETSLSVFTTWELSFGQIGQSEDERSVLDHFLTLSAFFGGTNLSEDLFKLYFDSNRHQGWIQRFVARGKWDHHEYEGTLAGLLGASLLQNLDVSSAGSRFSLHPLVTDWLKLRITSESDRQKYTMEAIKVLTVYVDAKHQEALPLETNQDIISYVDVCLQNDREYSGRFRDLDTPSKRESAVIFASVYANHGRYQEAEAMNQRAVEGCKTALGPGHPSTLSAIRSLGCIYWRQNKLADAEGMYQKALEGFEKVLGPDHESTLDTINNLGILYESQGKLADAVAMCQRALVGFESTQGPDHLFTLEAANNLGVFYLRQGKIAEAEMAYQRALAGKEKTLGPDHVSTLKTVSNLGLLYGSQGMLAKAELMCQRALVGYEKVLGQDHIFTLETAGNLGLIYESQHKFAEAESEYRRASAGSERALGLDHPSTLRALNDLGLFYDSRGQHAEAEICYERALGGKENALGPNDAPTPDTVNSLCHPYERQGKLEEGKVMHQRYHRETLHGHAAAGAGNVNPDASPVNFQTSPLPPARLRLLTNFLVVSKRSITFVKTSVLSGQRRVLDADLS